MNVRRIISIMLLMGIVSMANAQSINEVKDTIPSSLVVSERIAGRDAGTRTVALPELRKIVAATGEADVIKYIQTLPGVSTGAEGSSAIYVRGGNIGSNLITLDGVSLYGGSHLLGLASVYPSEIISDADFRVGGFRGEESIITSSHISLKTVDGNFVEPSYSVSVSTFMLGGILSVPLVRNKLSLTGALRISPLGPAFRTVQSVVGRSLDSLSNPRAVVFDGFAKVKWRLDSNSSLSFSAFGSRDAYSYCYGGDSDESLGWGNIITNLRHTARLTYGWSVEDGVSYNRFRSQQGLVRDMNGTLNTLALVNSLDEVTTDLQFSRLEHKAIGISFGVRERFALFNPGSSATFEGNDPWHSMDSPGTGHVSHASITTAHVQLDMNKNERLEAMASAKLNIFAADEPENPSWKWRVDPEAGFQFKLKLTQWLVAEATADWTVQYYHTLEGIPLGWSVDLMVPANAARPPEKAQQFYAGLFATFGEHRITIGAYDKRMKNLVYFSDAGLLFTPAIAGWNHNIKVGTGASRGAEFLYEKDGCLLDWRVAYTLSKTNREFEDVNDGLPFPARFDRRHILNATASFEISENVKRSISLTGFFTFQSGHWETVAAGKYPALTFFGQEYYLDYFTSVNNYEMPSYIRMDVGCNFCFKTHHPQELNIGIYNVLNRHNPFSVIYDDRSREWRQVSLLPVMPSVNYKVSF